MPTKKRKKLVDWESGFWRKTAVAALVLSIPALFVIEFLLSLVIYGVVETWSAIRNTHLKDLRDDIRRCWMGRQEWREYLRRKHANAEEKNS